MWFLFDWGMDVLGIGVGLVFAYLHWHASRGVVGSAFRRYHLWMVLGALALSIAFIADCLAVLAGKIVILDIAHHVIFLGVATVFVTTNLYLPREASRYMDLHDETTKKGI